MWPAAQRKASAFSLQSKPYAPLGNWQLLCTLRWLFRISGLEKHRGKYTVSPRCTSDYAFVTQVCDQLFLQ